LIREKDFIADAQFDVVTRNLEDRKGRPARLVLGDPLPEEIELLPKAEQLHGCTAAGPDTPFHSNAFHIWFCSSNLRLLDDSDKLCVLSGH
jgi:hypothetical protein